MRELDTSINKAKFKLQMAELLDQSASARLKDLEARIAAFN
jgi:hypothetical protein